MSHGVGSSSRGLPLQGDASLKSVALLFPYLREFKGRVLLAFVLLVGAKLAAVAVPLLLKDVVDALNKPHAVLVLPLGLIIGYGLLRFSSTVFSDLRDVVFGRVTQRAIRRVGLAVFEHLHSLSLRFHLERQTGGISRDIERGAKAISSLAGFLLFRIAPTLVEITMVAVVLFVKLDWVFALITLGTLIAYIWVTVSITEWRNQFRRRMNELDSEVYTKAIDSLLNYETVKYFGNERFESRRYDASLEKWEAAAVKSQTTLGLLNATQAGIIALGVVLMVARAAQGVVNHTLRRARHHEDHAQGDDAGLGGVEQAQRGLALDRRLLPLFQAAIVAPGLEALIAEILHRLIVKQAVDGLGVGLRVQFVHAPAELVAPLGDAHRDPDIRDERA